MEDDLYQDHLVSFSSYILRGCNFESFQKKKKHKLGDLEEYNKPHSHFKVRLKFPISLTPPPPCSLPSLNISNNYGLNSPRIR